MLNIEKDVQMMQDPDKWPAWPFLPLVNKKRTIADPDYCGFLYCISGKNKDPKVYIGNIFMPPTGTKEYPSFEEIAREWRVD